MIAKGEDGEGMEWEFEISRCKLVYIAWINNQAPLYRTIFDILLQSIMEKDFKKNICVCVYMCIYTHTCMCITESLYCMQKLTHCKSTILQLFFLKKDFPCGPVI